MRNSLFILFLLLMGFQPLMAQKEKVSLRDSLDQKLDLSDWA